MFITVMLVFYDVVYRRVDIVSAGHNPMLYYHAATGQVDQINPAGMPLGVPLLIEGNFGDHLEHVRLTLEDDDCFLMYTDGITEAVNQHGGLFGLDRLSELLSDCISANKSINSTLVTERIINQLDDFAGFDKQTDDITFIVARATAIAATGMEPHRETVDLISVEDIGKDSDHKWSEGH